MTNLFPLGDQVSTVPCTCLRWAKENFEKKLVAIVINKPRKPYWQNFRTINSKINDSLGRRTLILEEFQSAKTTTEQKILVTIEVRELRIRQLTKPSLSRFSGKNLWTSEICEISTKSLVALLIMSPIDNAKQKILKMKIPRIQFVYKFVKSLYS